MFRYLPALTMLAAHMLGMCVPVCFVRCVASDGTARIQPVIARCVCCAQASGQHEFVESLHQTGCCGRQCDHRLSPNREHTISDDLLVHIGKRRPCCKHSQIEVTVAARSNGPAHSSKLSAAARTLSIATGHLPLLLNGSLHLSNLLAMTGPAASAPLRALGATILRC
jgi:hypothetical protein